MKGLALLLLILASAALADSPKPAIVLVHGAFADASGWSRVIPILERDGYFVTAVQIPLTSLSDDIATAKRVVDAQKGPVFLVGQVNESLDVRAAGSRPRDHRATVGDLRARHEADLKIGRSHV